MGELVDFVAKKQTEDGAFYYIFFYEKSSYAMFVYTDTNVIKYGKAKFEGNQIIVDKLENDESQVIFDATYDIFFLEVENVCTLRLIAYFTNHLGVFTMYYDEYDENGEAIFYEVIDCESVAITDDLKLRRVQKWFDQHYIIR